MLTTAAKYMVNAVPPFVFPIDIPGDSYPPDEDLMEEDPVFGADIPSVWDGLPANFDIEFWVEHSYTYTEGENDLTATYEPPFLSVSFVNDVTPLSSIVPTYIDTDIINIAPTIAGAFPDEKFVFIFPDLSTKELPRYNTENWMSVKEWKQPSKNEEKIFYHFNLVYGEMEVIYPDQFTPTIIPGGTISLVLSQYVYWSWQISLSSFKNDVEESKKRLEELSTTRTI